MEPSAYLLPDVPMDAYVADRGRWATSECPATLNSGLAHVLLTKSAAHVRYHHPRLNPSWAADDDRKFDGGKAAHAVLLEGKTISALPYENYRKHEAQKARDAVIAEGGYPVLAEHASDIACMVASARALMKASPDLEGILSLMPELTAVWQERGTWLRCRPDWLTIDKRLIVSVKTTKASAEPDAFLRTALNGGYDVQAAFELAGVTAATGITPTHYIWLVMETDAPFACSLVGLSPMLRDLGERKMASAVAGWAHCLATDEWPGYGVNVVSPDPPEWALSRFIDRHGYHNPDPDDGRDVSDQLMELR